MTVLTFNYFLMNEALALYGDRVDASIGEKSQNVIQSQREVPSQTYHPRSVSTLVLGIIDNESLQYSKWSILSEDVKIEENTPSQEDRHFINSLSLKIKNFFSLPYFVDFNKTKDCYINFLKRLKKDLEETDKKISSTFEDEILEYMMYNANIHILFRQFPEGSKELEDFKNDCVKSAPKFLKKVFI